MKTTSELIAQARILIVDDEKDTRELVQEVLRRQGAEVRTSASVAEALRTLGQWEADLLVSDIGMPSADGYELIRRVRKLDTGERGQIPAVALTAYAGAEDVKVGEKAFEIVTIPQDFEAVKKALADAKVDTSLAEITLVPQNTVRLEEKDAEQMLRLMEVLDEHDDVQKVHANFDIPDAVIEKVAAAAAG